MKSYGNHFYLKKNFIYESQKSSEKIINQNIRLIHKIFDTVNISIIEEFYISELESLNIYKKTKPEDLIYLNKIPENKESLFKKNLSSFIEGFSDSKYQKGY